MKKVLAIATGFVCRSWNEIALEVGWTKGMVQRAF